MARTEVVAKPLESSQEMTFEEYLEWHPDGRLAEWVDGRGILLPLPTYQHQEIAIFLATLLRVFCDVFALGKILPAGYPVKLELEGAGSAREPDVLFVSKERQERITRQYLSGAADLAIEVVSPESVTRDRRDKYAEYEAAGVREYWILDPDRKDAKFYRLGEDRRYREVAVENGIFRSGVLPGFWLRVEWLWQEPLPSTHAVLRELSVL